MNAGRLIAVVGPSGVGKDSVMAGIARAAPEIGIVRRVMTRAPGLAGEEYDSVSPDDFAARKAAGSFCLSWHAHGLDYGIPASVLIDVKGGAQRMANLSRSALADAADLFPALVVLNISASPETLAQRLAGRGRETASEIAQRLAKAQKPLPDGLRVINLDNDGPLNKTVESALATLQPVRG